MGFHMIEKVSWEDIQALYTSLNEARTKFTLATVEVPENPGLTIPANIQALNDSVNDMSSISFLTNIAVTGVVVPSTNELLKGKPFQQINGTISSILDTCPHDTSGGDSGGGGCSFSGGGDSCSSNRGGFFFGFGGHGSFVCGSFGGAARGNSGCFSHRSSCYTFGG